jgi:hypothetical protein
LACCPAVNMWWSHTLIDNAANNSSDSAIPSYANTRRPEKIASTSATAPTNGK